MEVLFTLLAERYERRRVVLTTNLVFSDGNRIFKDPLTTLAAIDRVVHHSVILDLMAVESYRALTASEREAGARPAVHDSPARTAATAATAPQRRPDRPDRPDRPPDTETAP
jgi:hypothetical protein